MPQSDRIDVFVPMRAMPKPRPRSTRDGQLYMPDDFQQWRTDFGLLLVSEINRTKQTRRMEGPVRLTLEFRTDGVVVGIAPQDTTRPTHVRGDIDNLAGGIMEVLQDQQIIDNDSKVHRLYANVAT